MTLHYVDDVQRQDEKPPASEVGVLGWLRKNLFSSIGNTITTVVIIALIWMILPGVLQWGVFDANWTGTDPQVCRDNRDGACWPFVHEKFRLILFGLYPYAEQWRPTLATLLLVAMLVVSCDRRMWNRNLLAVWYGGMVVVGVLMWGGPLSVSTILYVVSGAALVATWAMLEGKGDESETARAGRLLMMAMGGIFVAVFILGQFTPVLRGLQMQTGLRFVPTANWGGLPLTLGLSVIGLAFAFPFGILLALGRRSNMPVIRMLCIGYIELIRGVPLITVLIVSSVLFPLFLPTGVSFDKLLRAQIALIMFAAAYLAEVVRGGLQAIPKGQYEAADSLGLGFAQKTRLIILPQALRISIPPLVNTFIGFFKDTSLVIVIGLFDLLGAAKAALTDAAWRGFYKESYLFVAVIYFVFCYSMSRYSQRLEKQVNVGTRRG